MNNKITEKISLNYFYIVNCFINSKAGKIFKKPFFFILGKIWKIIPWKPRYPTHLYIYLTTKCNLRCFICRRENYHGENLSRTKFKLFETLIKNAKVIDLTGWGEPLLYPHFLEILDYIETLNNGRNISLTTNGTLLNAEFAKKLKGKIFRLVISLNAATEETYNRDMKGGDFFSTLNSIQTFILNLNQDDIKHITLHLVAHQLNYTEIPEFIILAKRLGVKTVSIGNYFVGRDDHIQYSLYNIQREYNNVLENSRIIARKNGIRLFARNFFYEQERPRTLCRSPYQEVFIHPNGDIVPCCYCGNFVMGNIFQENNSFEKIWFGPIYEQLRKKRFLPGCKKCNAYIKFDDLECHFIGNYRVNIECGR